MVTLSRYTKKSKIHLINFPKDGAGVYTYTNGVELFETYKVSNHVKKINEIKDKFDICITMGVGERIAYLADLNYITYYVGRDIDAPRFIKNSKEEGFNEPLHTLNFLERKFYRNAFDGAIAHVAGTWVFKHLQKYTDDGIEMNRVPVDPTVFNANVEPLDRKKTKFTFFCPQRMEHFKGTDLIWSALPLCKSDFEVLQVEWFGETQEEEKRFKKQLLENVPPQVKFIPMIKREDMVRYYRYADAVLGNMRLGVHELVVFEGIFCKKPVLNYANPEIKIVVDGKEIKSSFLPNSNDPKEIAKTIDKLVESKEFMEKLFEEEYKFTKEIADLEKFAKWWDELFEDLVRRHKSIRKNSSPFRIKLRMMLFLLANRLYLKKIKSKLLNNK